MQEAHKTFLIHKNSETEQHRYTSSHSAHPYHIIMLAIHKKEIPIPEMLLHYLQERNQRDQQREEEKTLQSRISASKQKNITS